MKSMSTILHENTCNIELTLCTFSTFSSTFTQQRTFFYESKEFIFDGLMSDFTIWTSLHAIPRPKPLNRDPDYVPPTQLLNGLDSYNRPAGKRGYTVDDGPWSWSLSEKVQSASGSKTWQRLDQGLLSTEQDFEHMIASMRKDLSGKKFRSCRSLVFIHVRICGCRPEFRLTLLDCRPGRYQ